MFDNLFDVKSDLPVAAIAAEVTASVIDGKVTILSSDTGSGKTLYQTAHLASFSNEQVVVLVPRRLLAVNAAEIVAQLSGYTVGAEVGYAVGSQSGDVSYWTEDTKLLFATNGYALASGLIHTATTFVLDEVHETSLDLSIVRALLYRRIAQGEKIHILEMSATMNVQRQAAYWQQITETQAFEVDGKTFDCEVRHRPAGSIPEEVMNLIDEGRRGILVFRPGVGEVEDTVHEILALSKMTSLPIEVSAIYGDMSYREREVALAAPASGKVKVLVGTNVVESGANIAWLDAGVSCGTGKQNSIRLETGATHLKLVDLPKWRLSQQEGRVKRFCPGIFVLCSPKSFADREQTTQPEIERLALTELVMHCSTLRLRAHELVFDYTPEGSKVLEAEQKLQRLGLIDSECQLTAAGNMVVGLPVGPETGAMLWHAYQRGLLAAALPLAAVIEIGGVRNNTRNGHSLNSKSDHLDSLLAFRKVYFERGRERRDVMTNINVSSKRFEAVSELLRDLERRLMVMADFNFNHLEKDLLQVILAGSLDRLYTVSRFRMNVTPLKNSFASFSVGNGTVVNLFGQKLLAGDLRVITPRDSRKLPFTVLEKVSVVSVEDIREIAKYRPEILVEQAEPIDSWSGTCSQFINTLLFGEYFLERTIVSEQKIGSTMSPQSS